MLLIGPVVENLRYKFWPVIDLNSTWCATFRANGADHINHVFAADALVDPDSQSIRAYRDRSVSTRAVCARRTTGRRQSPCSGCLVVIARVKIAKLRDERSRLRVRETRFTDMISIKST
jgi:hypothetical protein